jgi:hypothetical protein
MQHQRDKVRIFVLKGHTSENHVAPKTIGLVLIGVARQGFYCSCR